MDKYESIKAFFQHYLPRLKVDKNLLKQIKAFKYGWGNKSEEYIEFLSNGLMGVYPIRFSLRDESMIFKDILNVDQEELQYEVYKVNGVNKDFKISSNIVNLTLVYLMHVIWTDSKLKEKDKLEGLNDLYAIFCYKQIGSMYSHFFKYNISLNEAQIVYERLSNQFLLKKLGSWNEVIKHQCGVLLPPKGNNTEKVTRLDTVDAVETINDMRNRISSIIKNVAEPLYEYINSDEAKLKSTTLVSVSEEGAEYKDDQASSVAYINSLKYSMVNINDFIVNDLVYLIRSLLPNIKKDKFEEALYYLVAVEPSRINQYDYCSAVIRGSFAYLRTRGIINNYNKKTLECLNKLKGYFSASKVKELDVVESKKVLEDMVVEGLGIKTKWIVTPIVIGVCLYLFLRAIYRQE